jgi:hypothetical protein
MPLDETAKLSNIMRSLKKYFVDSLHTAESIQLDFDKSYQDVYAALPGRVDQWIIIALNPSNMDSLAELAFTIYMYSRKDPEAVDLFILRDKVMGYLIDIAQTDGLARMTLYDVAWTPIGAAVIVLPAGRQESDNFVAKDGTKFRYISASLRWGAKG